MKRFKQFDIIAQAVFFMLYILALVFYSWQVQIALAVACLGWQLLSLFIHHIRHWFIKKHFYRGRFGKIITLVAFAALTSVTVQFTFASMIPVALVLSACGYLFICISEVHLLLKRPLSYLK